MGENFRKLAEMWHFVGKILLIAMIGYVGCMGPTTYMYIHVLCTEIYRKNFHGRNTKKFNVHPQKVPAIQYMVVL